MRVQSELLDCEKLPPQSNGIGLWRHVLPAHRKWFTRLCAAAVIVQALVEIEPRYPVPDEATRAELLQAKSELKAEASAGSP